MTAFSFISLSDDGAEFFKFYLKRGRGVLTTEQQVHLRTLILKFTIWIGLQSSHRLNEKKSFYSLRSLQEALSVFFVLQPVFDNPLSWMASDKGTEISNLFSDIRSSVRTGLDKGTGAFCLVVYIAEIKANFIRRFFEHSGTYQLSLALSGLTSVSAGWVPWRNYLSNLFGIVIDPVNIDIQSQPENMRNKSLTSTIPGAFPKMIKRMTKGLKEKLARIEDSSRWLERWAGNHPDLVMSVLKRESTSVHDLQFWKHLAVSHLTVESVRPAGEVNGLDLPRKWKFPSFKFPYGDPSKKYSWQLVSLLLMSKRADCMAEAIESVKKAQRFNNQQTAIMDLESPKDLTLRPEFDEPGMGKIAFPATTGLFTNDTLLQCLFFYPRRPKHISRQALEKKLDDLAVAPMDTERSFSYLFRKLHPKSRVFDAMKILYAGDNSRDVYIYGPGVASAVRHFLNGSDASVLETIWSSSYRPKSLDYSDQRRTWLGVLPYLPISQDFIVQKFQDEAQKICMSDRSPIRSFGLGVNRSYLTILLTAYAESEESYYEDHIKFLVSQELIYNPVVFLYRGSKFCLCGQSLCKVEGNTVRFFMLSEEGIWKPTASLLSKVLDTNITTASRTEVYFKDAPFTFNLRMQKMDGSKIVNSHSIDVWARRQGDAKWSFNETIRTGTKLSTSKTFINLQNTISDFSSKPNFEFQEMTNLGTQASEFLLYDMNKLNNSLGDKPVSYLAGLLSMFHVSPKVPMVDAPGFRSGNETDFERSKFLCSRFIGKKVVVTSIPIKSEKEHDDSDDDDGPVYMGSARFTVPGKQEMFDEIVREEEESTESVFRKEIDEINQIIKFSGEKVQSYYDYLRSKADAEPPIRGNGLRDDLYHSLFSSPCKVLLKITESPVVDVQKGKGDYKITGVVPLLAALQCPENRLADMEYITNILRENIVVVEQLTTPKFFENLNRMYNLKFKEAVELAVFLDPSKEPSIRADPNFSGVFRGRNPDQIRLLSGDNWGWLKQLLSSDLEPP